MTLGEPQPLSRRQARELARQQGEDVTLAEESLPHPDVSSHAPEALRPPPTTASARTPSQARSSHHQHAGSEKTEAARHGGSPSIDSAPDSQPVEPAADRLPHTLSRRELRALNSRDEAHMALAAGDQSSSGSETTGDASVTAEPFAAEPVAAEPVIAVPVAAVPDTAVPFAAEPVTAVSGIAEPVTAAPRTAGSISTGPGEAHLLRTRDVESGAQTGWTPPIQHWSAGTDSLPAPAAQPDQSLDELINRSIGSGGIPTTTNALILPSIPHQPGGVTPITNTGEIMITGSFDLPRSLGATGAHPNLFDSSEMDHLMDQLDTDQIGGDSAPVSASHAVSTHASTRGVLTPPKKQRASLPMILVVAPAILAVSVLALFVTGYLLGNF